MKPMPTVKDLSTRSRITVPGLIFGLVGLLTAPVDVLSASLGSFSTGERSTGRIESNERAKFATDDVLSKFEALPDSPYRLGTGDGLTLEIWDHPELSGSHTVGPDGRISLSTAGSLHIADLTREEATQAVRDTYSSYYLDLVVTLRVDRYASNRIHVLGRVTHPGSLQFDAVPTLLEAITRAGGLPVGGVGADKATLVRCAVFRGRDQAVWIDLRSLLKGNIALNIRLRRDDLVYIPDSDDRLVYVFGEVRNPGVYEMTPDMTFIEALARAGGPTEDASIKHLKVVRPRDRQLQEVNLEKILVSDPDLNMALVENDIIYVPKNGLAKFHYVVSKLNPFTSLWLFAATLRSTTKP